MLMAKGLTGSKPHVTLFAYPTPRGEGSPEGLMLNRQILSVGVYVLF